MFRENAVCRRSREVAVFSALVLLLAAAPRLWAQGEPPPGREPRGPSLMVSGRAEAEAQPDRAVVTLGAAAQAKDAAAAQDQVNQVMQNVLSHVKALGIAEKDIRTSGLSLSPVYERQRSGEQAEPKIVAYRAGHNIVITLNDLKKIGPAIDAAIGAGANQLQGISFELQDDLAPRQQALSEAVHNARAKAETMAAALGVRLGEVMEAEEGGVNIVRPEYAGRRFMAGAAFAATPVEPGQVRISATVTIRYRVGAGR